MIYRLSKSTFLFSLIAILSCGNIDADKKQDIQNSESSKDVTTSGSKIIVGANRTQIYLPLLLEKNVGLLGNPSSLIETKDGNYIHLVDSLLAINVNLTRVFAPEHGFRGEADAGEKIKDGKDPKTHLPVISLYGKNKKPGSEQLKDLDILIFDLQDVGARFYTYISSLHYVMEACAENSIPLIILDRPNPNGHYIDGPVLEPSHQSFVGMHPVPVVHGMTMGEYAKMINGEGWLKNGIQCKLHVIPMENYNHSIKYSLPVKPSPNLPNEKAVNLYPSLCFFEGTSVNAGRGTGKQFQVFGSPFLNPEKFDYQYTPVSMAGAKSPKHLNHLCYGKDLSESNFLKQINLEWLKDAYESSEDKKSFFNSFFTKLAGTRTLQQQIQQGLSSEEIRKSWQPALKTYKETRKKYVLYP